MANPELLPPPPMDLKANPSFYRWLQTIFKAFNDTSFGEINNQLAVINQQIAALQARPQVHYGTGAPANVFGGSGDWFADTSGHHIYVKAGVTWVLVV